MTLWQGRLPTSGQAHHLGKELAGALSLRPGKGACRGLVPGEFNTPTEWARPWSSSRQGRIAEALIIMGVASLLGPVMPYRQGLFAPVHMSGALGTPVFSAPTLPMTG